MPQTNIPSPFGDNEFNRRPNPKVPRLARQSDLVEVVLGPLSAQLDQARLEILGKIRDIEQSVAIIARQIRRGLEE